jgi:16S rRNA pseudouridine516 synthase
MLNKPKGTICATKDDNGKTVLELIAEPLRKNLFPAGRLDKDSEGFVLLTDDGPFAHRLLSPRSRIPKTYLATLDRPPDKDILAELFCSPIDLGGGDITSPALLENVDGVTARLTIYEGMFHQVKRMFLKAGYKVEGLRRIRIGALELDPGLGPGEYRPILPGEMPLLIRQD